MPRSRRPEPRWQTPLPEGVAGSWGPDVDATARKVLGFGLDDWQRRALNRALATREDGTLVHNRYVISAARQNGKSALVRALLAWALTAPSGPQWSYMLGLAHDRAQARIPYEAVMHDLGPIQQRYGRSALTVTRYLGIRSSMFGRRREYHTGSREARNAIRGLSVDLGLFDEVRTQTDWATFAALEPTTTARPDPLILATSTAGDDRSVVLREWWERGRRIIDGAAPAAGFGMTWYAAPDDLAPDDPRAWRLANPAVAEGRIDIARIAEAYEGSPAAVFRSERLNLWSDAVDEWLPPGAWARGIVAAQPGRDGVAVTFGVEAVPSWRRASIVAAFPTADGTFVGVVGSIEASGAALAPAELMAEVERLAGLWRPTTIAYSATTAAAPHIEAWCEAHDVVSMPLAARQVRQASESFRAEVVGRRIAHLDDPLLAYQVRVSRPSGPLEGGDWYLSVRESTGEVDAIRSAAWATWGSLYPPEVIPPVQLFL